jgi:hypothetical protein
MNALSGPVTARCVKPRPAAAGSRGSGRSRGLSRERPRSRRYLRRQPFAGILSSIVAIEVHMAIHRHWPCRGGAAMTDNDRAVLEGALRITNDLSDVLRAIAVAAKLVGEKLELLEAQLIELLVINKEGA